MYIHTRQVSTYPEIEDEPVGVHLAVLQHHLMRTLLPHATHNQATISLPYIHIYVLYIIYHIYIFPHTFRIIERKLTLSESWKFLTEGMVTRPPKSRA
jgi:hypothetical protein